MIQGGRAGVTPARDWRELCGALPGYSGPGYPSPAVPGSTPDSPKEASMRMATLLSPLAATVLLLSAASAAVRAVAFGG